MKTSPVPTWGSSLQVIFMCPFCPHVGSVFARESRPGRGGLAPCGIVRAELRMLSSWLHGKPEGLIVPDGRIQVGHPVHQMIELHDPILRSRPANG